MLRTASVAMAACNGERFLPQQVESILEQLEAEDELIVSYDESSDGTLDIIEGYRERDSRVIVVRNDDPGIVGNFNNALAACSKDVIFISDQDDIWAEGKRAKIMGILNETGAELAIHNVVHVDEDGNVISKPLFEEYGIGPGKLRNFAKPRYSGCCMAFPRSTMNLIYPMPESVVNYDHWIGMACELFGSITFVEDILLYHRLHGGNATVPRRSLRVVARQRFNLLVELGRRRG